MDRFCFLPISPQTTASEVCPPSPSLLPCPVPSHLLSARTYRAPGTPSLPAFSSPLAAGGLPGAQDASDFIVPMPAPPTRAGAAPWHTDFLQSTVCPAPNLRAHTDIGTSLSEAWSQANHPPHQQAYWKCESLDPTPDSEALGAGPKA